MRFTKVCRTCLGSKGVLCPLFSSTVTETAELTIIAVVDLLASLSKIVISDDDGLPDKICTDCIDEIQRFYSFTLKCQRSDAFLKQSKLTNHKPNTTEKQSPSTELMQIKQENLFEENNEIIHIDLETDETDSTIQPIKLEPELNIEIDELNLDPGRTRSKKTHQCLICSKRFKYKSKLSEHMKMHIISRPQQQYKCEICSKVLGYKSSLRDHIRLKHAISRRKELQCKICSKNLISKSKLADHMRSHTGEKPFKCYVCQKPYPYRTSLRGHMRVKHPFIFAENCDMQCEICSKSFASKMRLLSHMRSHIGEQPEQCENCWISSEIEKNHEDDNGARNHKLLLCVKCPERFHEKTAYFQHLKSHCKKQECSKWRLENMHLENDLGF